MNAITSSSDKFVYDMLCELDRHPKAKYVRIHVSGDFYDVDYTERWRRIIAARPDIKFYALTRSWRISELKTKLEELRALPNCVIRASTDEQTGPPPEGWLEGGIEKTYTEGGILCPYFDKGIQCDKCLLCYKGTKAIYFKEH